MKFHKVKDVSALPGMRLSVQFSNGTTKPYDVKPLLERLPVFADLEDEGLFSSVEVDQGGYGIVWNDDIDLSCDELWEHGAKVASCKHLPDRPLFGNILETQNHPIFENSSRFASKNI